MSECRKQVDLQRVESGELLGSEGAAAENKVLKKQMQWEEIHLVSPLCHCAVVIKVVERKIGCKQASI